MTLKQLLNDRNELSRRITWMSRGYHQLPEHPLTCARKSRDQIYLQSRQLKSGKCASRLNSTPFCSLALSLFYFSIRHDRCWISEFDLKIEELLVVSSTCHWCCWCCVYMICVGCYRILQPLCADVIKYVRKVKLIELGVQLLLPRV